jgi:DNA-binding MarR family transcriptional regulator
MKLAKFLDTYPLWAAYRLHERLVVPMQKILKEHELTFLQSLILAAMYFEDAPVSPSELTKLFGTSLPNMSHSLKHLRLLGFVDRHIDDTDARKSRYVITPKAKSCLTHVINVHHTTQETMERKHTTHEINMWCQFAARLTQSGP